MKCFIDLTKLRLLFCERRQKGPVETVDDSCPSKHFLSSEKRTPVNNLVCLFFSSKSSFLFFYAYYFYG